MIFPVTSTPAPTSRLPAIVVTPAEEIVSLFVAASTSLILNNPPALPTSKSFSLFES